MTPYYDDGTCVIYHGDCREVGAWRVADVIVTDPPYGINLDTDYSGLGGTPDFNRRHGSYRGTHHAPIHGDAEPYDPHFLLATGKPTLLFGANHYADKLPAGTWHVWDKREELASNMLADFEIVWTSYPSGPSRIMRHKWLGYMRASEVGVHLHPTQKPLSLMRWAMTLKCPPGIVADPFMGSGSTLRAAKDLGRKAIGIEIDEGYCEIAAKRLAQEVLDFGITA